MYTGQTLIIPCDKGGLYGNPNANDIPPEMMTEVRNINLDEGGRESRGGSAHVFAAAISGTPQIMGFYDFILKNGNQFQVFVTSDGEIRKNESTVIKSGWTTIAHASFTVFGENLYICNGAFIPQVWDGSAGTTSDISTVPAEWTGTNYPKQMIKHGRKNSERLWAFGCPDNPFSIYVSVNGSDSFGAGSLRIDIETTDGSGIVGGIVFGDRIIFFSKSQAFVIDDSSFTTSEWGYQGAQWDSGLAHRRLLIRTPNDIVAMMENGEIYAFTAEQKYGDYKAASLLKRNNIQTWIKNNVNLTVISQFHGLYNPTERAVHIFVASKNSSQVDTDMIYYIDTQQWTIHDSLDNPTDSGYNASCAAIVRKSVGDYRIYTGDYEGFIWRLGESSKNDNGNGYYSGWTTPGIDMNNTKARKRYKRGRIHSVGKGDYNINIKPEIDEVARTERTVNQFGSGFLLGDATNGLLGTSSLGSDNPSVDKIFRIGGIGKRLVLEVYNSSVNESFFVKKLLLDHTVLGMQS